ncbi:MAG: hypothetical protein R3C15_23565, partial [Thermoleophilia bacterium]
MSRFLRTPIVPLVLIVVVVFLGFQALSPRDGDRVEMTYGDLITLVRTQPQAVDKVVFKPKAREIDATLADDRKVKVNYPSEQSQIEFQKLLQDQDVDFDSTGSGASAWGFLLYLLPFVLFLGLWFFLMSRMQGGGSKVMSFGKSRAKRMSPDSPKVTFRDV